MTTLSRRANPTQKRMFRIIEGAIKNAADAHPGKIDISIARSVSKRAVGTLSAQFAEVLAAREIECPPEMADDRKIIDLRQPSIAHSAKQSKRGSPQVVWRSPLRYIWKELSWRVGEAKRQGKQERVEALVEALRIVSGRMERNK